MATTDHPPVRPLSSYDRGVRHRIATERSIFRRVHKALRGAGYTVRVHSGDDWETPPAASLAVCERAFNNLDDCWLIAFKGGRRVGWVRFVMGNDGWDVINDYTTNLESVLSPVNSFAAHLS